jgi:hypothetical protein
VKLEGVDVTVYVSGNPPDAALVKAIDADGVEPYAVFTVLVVVGDVGICGFESSAHHPLDVYT